MFCVAAVLFVTKASINIVFVLSLGIDYILSEET